jgi:uncharacterized Zn finger protein (UPF0148 family)
VDSPGHPFICLTQPCREYTTGRGYHTFCLTPPLWEVPDGRWVCPNCESEGEAEEITSDSGGSGDRAAVAVAADQHPYSSDEEANQRARKTRRT